jgi:hypothetical protein
MIWVVSENFGKHETVAVFSDRNKLIDFLIENEAYNDGGKNYDAILDDFAIYAEQNEMYTKENDGTFDEWIGNNYDEFLKFVRMKCERDIYYLDEYEYNICSFYLNES